MQGANRFIIKNAIENSFFVYDRVGIAQFYNVRLAPINRNYSNLHLTEGRML